jgi:hypothetical protein
LVDPVLGSVMLELVEDGGRLKLAIRNVSNNFYRHNSDGEKVLSIDQDSEITFLLDKKVAWTWAGQPGPFRLKKQSSAKYYRIKKGSEGPNGFVLEAKASGLDRHNPVANQPFNLHVMIEQDGGRAFPVCIDPDGQNPPR